MDEEGKLPPSLAQKPNIPWDKQTRAQLIAERDYWLGHVKTAPGLASASAADGFRKACEVWIERLDHHKGDGAERYRKGGSSGC